MKKRILSSALLLLLLCAVFAPCVSAAPYDSYTYVENGSGIRDVKAPAAYLPKTALTAASLGVTLAEPSDLVATADGFYLADAGANAVYVFDRDWHLRFTIGGEGAEGDAALTQPNGLFVSADGTVYVADTGGHRLALYGADGRYQREIRLQDSTILADDYTFEPMKLVVADSGSLFVAAKGALEGLMELSPEGELYGFVGSNKVSYDPLELIWRKIFTEIQRKTMVQYVPVEYKNITMDSSGMLYTVTDVTDVSDPVKRLNQSGDDVLLKNSTLSNNKVMGDLVYPTWYQLDNYGPSTLVDIAADENGSYYVLDAKRGRVFAYDEDGNILFEFGGRDASRTGLLSQPVAIELDGTDILILDKDEKKIQIYAETDYTALLATAQNSYRDGDYAESYQQWMSVLGQNSNYSLAYVKAGYCQFRQSDYGEAMRLFKLGNARTHYSKAFVKYRRAHLNTYFPWYFLGLAVVIGGLVTLSVVQRKRAAARPAAAAYNAFLPPGRCPRLRFAAKTALHPYRGFGSIKEEGNGSVTGAVALLFLLFLSTVFCRQVRAFLFNTSYNSPVDLMAQLRLVLIPVVLFVIANWSITTLMDGKGTMREILIVTGNAVLPLIVIPAVISLLTQVMTQNEAAFVSMGDALAWGWCILLLFIGIMEIHQYSAGRTVLVFLLTAVSALIIVFICLLFFSLLQEISGFVYSLYKELILRL